MEEYMNMVRTDSHVQSASTALCLRALMALCLVTTFAAPTTVDCQTHGPARILLTNDDGIEEVADRVYPLAQELRRFAEVYIVVANQDRSGSTHFMSLSRKVALESRLEYASSAGDGLHKLEIHVVDGFPADCVALGVRGIMGEDPPDLVISGPNGGPNLADGWFGSGTIGAARTAAYMGIPALAISGLDDDSEEQVSALSRWVAELAQSELVNSLPEQTYLTVALPRVPPSQVAGIRVARRAQLLGALSFERLAEVRDPQGGEEMTSVWVVRYRAPTSPPSADSDVVLYSQDYIVITPMRADEHDSQLLDQLMGSLDRLPSWPPR
jgi:5'-nucleotidase